jgi:hypothetical protein
MDSVVDVYHYRPLQGGAIRLLKLEAGSGDQPLCADLQHVQLREQMDWRWMRNPYFEALSYTWGDPSITEDLLLCDSTDSTRRTLKITSNLANALKKLRYPNRPRSVLSFTIERTGLTVYQSPVGRRCLY